jgi:hypothetical protein
MTTLEVAGGNVIGTSHFVRPKCRNDAQTTAISDKRLQMHVHILNVDRKLRASIQSTSPYRCISKRSSMLRNGIVVLAIVLVLGSSGLSASAFARSGGYGRGGGGDGFRGNHFGGFGGTASDGYGGYGNRASGLRGGFRGYGARDVWGHWGAYYGPMIPTI